MIEGKTRTGFKYKVDERILKDWRIVSCISMVESSDPSSQIKGTTELVKLLIGENEDAFIKHVQKKNDGFVPIDAITNELVDILTSSKETKN